MKLLHPIPWIRMAAGILWAATHWASAEVLDARLRIDPPHPYVHQQVTMILEVATTPGSQLRNISIGDVIDRVPLEMEALSTEAPARLRRDGKEIEWHRYRAKGRGTAPVNATLQPKLSLTLVERRSTGFFTRWTTLPRRMTLPEMDLNIVALPLENQPAGFAGAVGSFRLAGELTPSIVMPGDLVDLKLEVTGQGYLGDALPSLPQLPETLFKQYSPEIQRLDTYHVRINRVIIPLSTQAVTVGRAVLPYFDPVAEEYRLAQTPPLRLTFTERQETTPTVRHLPDPTPTTPHTDHATRDFDRETMRVLPYAAGLLAALLVAAALQGKGARIALPASLLVLMVVAVGTSRLRGRQSATWLAQTDLSLRVAPGRQAQVIRTIPAGSILTPLEERTEWVRVEAQGRRGWIPKDRIAPKTTEETDYSRR